MKKPKETFVDIPQTPEYLEQRARIDRERWKRNKVEHLPDGFTSVTSGRAISIYYRKGDRFVEFMAELAGVRDADIVIFLPENARWIDVKSGAAMTADSTERSTLIRDLEAWLQRGGHRYSLSSS
jgi:hypothetical protein